MALNIETFSNIHGGNGFFKAITHPLAAPMFARLARRLAAGGTVAIYDPSLLFEGIAEFHDFSAIDVDGVFVQRVADIGTTIAGRRAPYTFPRDAVGAPLRPGAGRGCGCSESWPDPGQGIGRVVVAEGNETSVV